MTSNIDKAPIVLYEGQRYRMMETLEFANFSASSRDRRALARISDRIKRFANGNVGDVESVGDGVSEMRIHYGPGYRVYFYRRGADLVILLCGGDKSTQKRDIVRAKEIKAEVERHYGDQAL
jgi:putative addiction module killer protein